MTPWRRQHCRHIDDVTVVIRESTHRKSIAKRAYQFAFNSFNVFIAYDHVTLLLNETATTTLLCRLVRLRSIFKSPLWAPLAACLYKLLNFSFVHPIFYLLASRIYEIRECGTVPVFKSGRPSSREHRFVSVFFKRICFCFFDPARSTYAVDDSRSWFDASHATKSSNLSRSRRRGSGV